MIATITQRNTPIRKIDNSTSTFFIIKPPKKIDVKNERDGNQ